MLCAYHQLEEAGKRYAVDPNPDSHGHCSNERCDFYNAEYAERERKEKVKFQLITEATPPLNRIW